MVLRDKGTFFYSIAGVMVVILVLAVALYIMKSSHDPTLADSLRLRRFTDALYSVKTEIWSLGHKAEYPVVWRLGHDTDATGVNKYLAMGEGGRDQLRKDLLSGYTDELNTGLANRAVRVENGVYSIDVNGVLVNVSRIIPEDVSVAETDEGLRYVIKVHMEAASPDMKYDTNTNVTVESPFRFFDMFDRAKSFHESYNDNVQWATTIALYTRAYMNGYNPSYEGSFLREGHVAYDPLEPFLKGDVSAVKEFSIDSIGDLGSVPVATWLTEWQALGEPAYVVPGVDFDPSLEGNVKIIDLTRRNYDLEGAADCDSLEGDEKIECEEFNDPDVIKEKADLLHQEYVKLKELSDDLNAWYLTSDSTYKEMSCDHFRENAEEIIDKTVDEFKKDRAEDEIINPSMDYATGTFLEDEMNENNVLVNNLENLVTELVDIESSRLPELYNDRCLLDSLMDCKCAHGPEDCEDEEYCLECDNPSCIGPVECPNKEGDDYVCRSFEDGLRKEDVECDVEECDEVCEGEDCSWECESWTETYTAKIDQCNCMCYPASPIISDIKSVVKVIWGEIEVRLDSLSKQESELREREAVLREALDKVKKIDELRDGVQVSGYDVSGNIRFSEVRYYKGLTYSEYYANPTWSDRLNGTCGNGQESIALYTGQVSASLVCCAFFTPCCSIVKYASSSFPAIYRVEATYNIDEKLIDDRNRVMMHNIFAGDGDLYGMNVTPKLYTYAAPEFVIYQNHTVNVKSLSGERVLVYLYLPRIAQATGGPGAALEKVADSFDDPSCTGEPGTSG